MIFYGEIKEGKLIFGNPSHIYGRLSALNGKKVTVEIEETKTTRSEQQNKFLWSAIYGTIEQETGQNSEDIHEFCKSQFLPKRLVDILGKKIWLKGTTKRLSKNAFGDYVDKIQAYFADFGIQFPVMETPEEFEPDGIKIIKRAKYAKER